ncbi:hypothetical protein [Brevibacterium luteolum]|uniref:hypothetical protein n=1 Tax=Brevibacterium luteolum TaxID=199591 RepID=UPI00223B20F0|nr:hypothetical protein [Brevibacterium luteolum]MCT1828950.1 hypothetical protein [Brevibacterium luteolum]
MVQPRNFGDYNTYLGFEHFEPDALRFETPGDPASVSSTKQEFLPGDTIYGRLRPYFRKVGWSQNLRGICSTDFWVFEPKPGVDPRFVFYVAGSQEFTDLATSSSEGTRMPRASWSVVKDFEVLDFTQEEQRAIAATLGALDDKIESNRRSTSLISDLLDTHSEKFGAGLPTIPLGDIATPVKESLNPSNLGNTQVDHFSLPAFDRDARPERVAASSIMSNKLRVPKQAILLSRLNPRFNRTWWASADAEAPALASTEFLVLTSEDEQRLAAIWLALRDPFFRGEMPKRVTGTSGSHQRVKPADVLAIEVPDFTSAPTVLKESALAMLKRSESLRAESARLSALRDALLPELLSGRLRASVGKL